MGKSRAEQVRELIKQDREAWEGQQPRCAYPPNDERFILNYLATQCKAQVLILEELREIREAIEHGKG